MLKNFCSGLSIIGLSLGIVWANEKELLAYPSIKNIAVFCSADDKIETNIKKVAYNLGEMIAKGNYGLVTGGSKTGLMQEVTNGFAQQGTDNINLYGILPQVFKNAKIEHPLIPEKNLIWTQTLGTRLNLFQQMSDAVIVLPGGLGTFHELLDFLVHQQFKLIEKPILLFNLDNFWEGFLLQLKKMVEKNCLAPQHLKLFIVVETVEEALKNLSHLRPLHQGLEERYWEK